MDDKIKVKGKTIARYKTKDRTTKGKTIKSVVKITPAGEKVTIQKVKYTKKASENQKGTGKGVKSITKVTGNTQGMGYLGGDFSGKKPNQLSITKVKRYRNI